MPPKPGGDVPQARATTTRIAFASHQCNQPTEDKKMIEKLENRALLSATFPSLLGSYSGTYSYTSGDNGTITLSVYAQVHGLFFGITTQSDGMNSVIRGKIKPNGAVKFNVKPNILGRHGHGAGTFANGTFNATEVIKGRGVNQSGAIALTKN
jgi:hypothetical protein